MPEQQLNCAEVFGTTVNKRRFGPSHRMCTVIGTIQSQFINPMPKNSSVLPGT